MLNIWIWICVLLLFFTFLQLSSDAVIWLLKETSEQTFQLLRPAKGKEMNMVKRWKHEFWSIFHLKKLKLWRSSPLQAGDGQRLQWSAHDEMLSCVRLLSSFVSELSAGLPSAWERDLIKGSPHCDITPLSQWKETCGRTRRLPGSEFPPDYFLSTEQTVIFTVIGWIHNSKLSFWGKCVCVCDVAAFLHFNTCCERNQTFLGQKIPSLRTSWHSLTAVENNLPILSSSLHMRMTRRLWFPE